MSTSFPAGLDGFPALIDNTDNIVAAHPNDRGDAIEAIQTKLGVDSSAITTSHDYKFTHLPAQVQNWDAGAFSIRGLTLISDVANGTAPLTITSASTVSNLNADLLDSQEGTHYVDIANHLIASQAQGDILYRGASAWSRLGTGTAGQLLQAGGAAANPSWTTRNGVVQVVNTQSGTYIDCNTLMPYDDTIPQITEGDEVMTRAITPTSASNKLKIDIVVCGTSLDRLIVGLFQDTTAGALAAICTNDSNEGETISFTHYMTAGTASPTTFRVRAGANEGDFDFNGKNDGTRLFGGVCASSITITEIAV